MIKSLRDARVVDGLPRVAAQQDWVRALSAALGVLHEKALEYIDGSQIYTALDTATEPVLDTLAVNWKIDWYNTDYSLEQKRRLVKTALTIRRLMGTVSAVKLQADAIYPGTMLEEWFDYSGEPGTFRLYIDVTDATPEYPAIVYAQDEMERRLASAKRWSAHMESVSCMVRHALIARHTVENWLYRVPECGTIRCGTWWMPSTLGWSENADILTRADVGAFNATADLCGTLPDTAAVGYSLCGAMRSGGAAEAYTAVPPQSGQDRCGTMP